MILNPSDYERFIYTEKIYIKFVEIKIYNVLQRSREHQFYRLGQHLGFTLLSYSYIFCSPRHIHFKLNLLFSNFSLKGLTSQKLRLLREIEHAL